MAMKFIEKMFSKKHNDVIVENEEQFYCRKCGKFVPASDFHSNITRENGLQYYCKKHQIEFVQNYYWRNYDKCRAKAELRTRLTTGKITPMQYEKEMIKYR